MNKQEISKLPRKMLIFSHLSDIEAMVDSKEVRDSCEFIKLLIKDEQLGNINAEEAWKEWKEFDKNLQQ